MGETAEIKVLNIRNGNPGRLTIRRLASDSLLVDCDGCMRQRVTEELRVGLSPWTDESCSTDESAGDASDGHAG